MGILDKSLLTESFLFAASPKRKKRRNKEQVVVLNNLLDLATYGGSDEDDVACAGMGVSRLSDQEKNYRCHVGILVLSDCIH